MSSRTLTFSPTGSVQTHTIPAVAGAVVNNQVSFDCRGGAGGWFSGTTGNRGYGARVVGYFVVNPSDLISVSVGGQGGPSGYIFGAAAPSGPPGGAAGWGYHSGAFGGTSPNGLRYGCGGGGGGSSAIRAGAAGTTDVVEAGGGGGAADQSTSGIPGIYGAGGGGGQTPGAGGGGFGSNGGTGAGGGGAGAPTAAGGAPGATVSGASGSVAGGTAGAAGGVGGNSFSGINGPTYINGGGGGGGGGGGHVSAANGCGGGGGGGGSNVTGPTFILGDAGGGGGGQSFAAAAALGVTFYDNSQNGDGQVILTYSLQSICAITAPTGTITTTAQPVVAYTYSQVDGHAQDRYRLKVYATPPGGWGSFDPESGNYTGGTMVPAFDSGDVASSYLSGGIPVLTSLTNGTYRAYLKTHDSDPGGVWSQWTSSDFTQAVPGPNPPLLAAMAEINNARVHLNLIPGDNGLTLEQASFEGGTIAGWTANTNCVLSNSVAQALVGTHSLLVTPSAAGAVIFNMTVGTAALMPAAVGQTYTAMAWVRGTNARTVGIAIYWANSGGTSFAISSFANFTDTTTGWTQLRVTAVAPATTAYAGIQITYTATATTDTIWVDQAGIFLGANPVYALPAPTALTWEVQRSADGGLTWLDPIGMTALTAATPLVVLDLYDREAPREVPLIYRVRGSGLVTGLVVVGNWATATTRLSSDGNEWLHSLGNAALDAAVIREGPNLVGVSHEDQAVYYPEGRAEAVVIGGTIHAEGFTSGGTPMTLAFTSDLAWQNFLALRARREPVLLQTVYGDNTDPYGLEQYWIRLGADAATTRIGGPYVRDQTGQIRTVTMDAYVVARPTP